ncbi:MAG: hypothetical protein NT117_03760 [Gammaproteobacteria bacterium]|nr:hypothetical protein [Gammaproteobacteria bacterium]
MSSPPAAAPRSNTALIVIMVVLATGLAVAALVLFNMRQNQSGFWAHPDPVAVAPTPMDTQLLEPAAAIPSAESVAIDSATGEAYEPEGYDETVDADPAADAAAMAADAAAMATDAAATATDAAAASDADAGDGTGLGDQIDSDAEQRARDVAALEAERRATERRAAERRAAQARADARADAAAAERRLTEESAAIEAQARQQAQAMEDQRQNTPDRIYEQRRGACPGGFLGSTCRKKLRYELCDGRWSDSPPAGESVCESKNR